jgi:biopolymer transport protein ExbB
VEQLERRVEEVGQGFFRRMERFLPVLETTTTIAPLLGLLGTILGMVGTFNAIAAARSRQNSDAILSGIGEALYATATGLVVAIVAFVAYNAFAARAQTVTAETEGAVTSLINVLTEPELLEADPTDGRPHRAPAVVGR